MLNVPLRSSSAAGQGERSAERAAAAEVKLALYVAKNSRVSSPKYILGESYGGFRAAKVARP